MRRWQCIALAVLAASCAGAVHAAPSDGSADGDLTSPATDPSALFEFGRSEALAGRHVAAVRAFESLLAKSDSPRVRLELARSLAALGRRDESLAAYRTVLAAHPPEPVNGWVLSEMAALATPGDEAAAGGPPVREEGGWRWHPRVGVGAIADSNVNAGPTDATVQIFGLPFELTAASLAQRDLGAQAWLGLAATRPGQWGQWHADVQWSGTRYDRHGAFSGDAFSAQAGLARATAGQTLDVALALESQRQHDGNGRDTATLGAQGLHELTTSSALAWLGAVGHIHQHTATGADGGFVVGGGSLNLRHAAAAGGTAWLPASMEALVGMRVLRVALQDADRSHTDITPQLALQAATSLCDGCGVTLDLSRTEARYDGDDPAFGLRRTDRLRVLTLTFARAPAGAATASQAATSWQCVVERSVNASTLSAYVFDRTLLRCSREWVF